MKRKAKVFESPPFEDYHLKVYIDSSAMWLIFPVYDLIWFPVQN
jgi:hypothetical protein